MTSKTTQWIIWAMLMAVFSALTLTGHWTDLALAITVTAVFWYGIVPKPRSRQTIAARRAIIRKAMNTIQSIWHKIYPADH